MDAIRNQVDYRRLDAERARHHSRYVKHVEAHGLMCQECGGGGEYVDEWHNLGDHEFPAMYPRYEPCGWCEGTGKIPRHRRAEWLRWKRQCKAVARGR